MAMRTQESIADTEIEENKAVALTDATLIFSTFEWWDAKREQCVFEDLKEASYRFFRNLGVRR